MKPVAYLFAACCLTAGLTGCATQRNPLIDEPVASDAAKPAQAAPSAAAPAVAATHAPAQTETAATGTLSAAPAATSVAKAESKPATDKATGVQTTAPLSGFRRFLYLFTPYRVTVQQGNFISQEQVAQLKEGMTRDQVRFVLGTPLLADVFHAQRWDYDFRVQKGNGELTTSRVTVYFKDDKLDRFTGNDLPTEQDYIARLAGPIKTGNAKPESKPETKPESKPESKAEPATPAK